MDNTINILNVIEKHPYNFKNKIKNQFPNQFIRINSISGKTFSEKCYRFLTDNNDKCKVCGKQTKFNSFRSGFSKTCSRKCSSILGVNASKEKYGMNPSQVDSVKQKKKQTFLCRYGVESSLSLPDVINKRTESLKKKYNGSVLSHPSVRQKIKQKKRDSFVQSCVDGDRLIGVSPMFDLKTFTNISDRTLWFKCNKCNYEFQSHLMWGTTPSCKICNPASKFQSEVQSFLIDDLELSIDCNRFNLIDNREIDIFIPEKQIAIECDGLYWHSEITGGKTPYYHIQKTEMCNRIGIKLIHIFEDEWIYKKNIVKNKLRSIFNKNIQKIHARKCEIREISSIVKNKFLNENHIQGEDRSKIKLGLFYEGVLVAVMTFGSLRRSLGSISIVGEYEMYRYCTSVNVNGGAGKLLSYFIRTYSPSKIISYCDIRWSGLVGNVYEKLKFVRKSQTKCNYWYILRNKRLHRFNFRKNILKNKLEIVDSNISEWENMKLNGYDRIWDCGSLKYELSLL